MRARVGAVLAAFHEGAGAGIHEGVHEGGRQNLPVSGANVKNREGRYESRPVAAARARRPPRGSPLAWYRRLVAYGRPRCGGARAPLRGAGGSLWFGRGKRGFLD